MNDDLVALAKLRLEEIVAFYGLNVKVAADERDNTIELNIDEADNTGGLIGHRGETLTALQQLMNAIIRSHTTERVFVNIDIAGYKKGRAEHLEAKVKEDAQKVIETGEEKYLRPMNAAERRIVHMALAEMPEVVTESEGEGHERRVVIRKKA